MDWICRAIPAVLAIAVVVLLGIAKRDIRQFAEWMSVVPREGIDWILKMVEDCGTEAQMQSASRGRGERCFEPGYFIQ